MNGMSRRLTFTTLRPVWPKQGLPAPAVEWYGQELTRTRRKGTQRAHTGRTRSGADTKHARALARERTHARTRQVVWV